MTTSESHSFKAEIKQVLQILIHSLYKERDIFLRELISNASDALTRLNFEMLTNDNVLDAEAELAIHLEVVEDGDDKTLVIKDSGIGMTREELVQNLGTIAQSGAREFLSKLTDADKQGDLSAVIGQFGVGFYSVFMAADEVRVVSRSHQPDAEAAAWISDGGDSYTIESADKADRGTEIHIKLKADAVEFADKWKLRQILMKHSNFVSYPIYIDEEQVNEQTSIWRKNSSEVSDEDANKFFQQMTMEFEEPLTRAHFSIDAPINVRGLLFVPAKLEKGMFSQRQEPGVKLYANNVLIQEYCTDLLPKWLEFVDGVVDSEDLSLNVSRESIQNTRLMRTLSKTVTKRVLNALKKLAKDEEKYATFWAQFKRPLKEGLLNDPTAKDDVLPLFRFSSSKADGLTSLDAYVERMGEAQDAIYYVLADDVSSAKNSPHLDPFMAQELEVLYLTDPIDSFVVAQLNEYNEKPLKNVDSVELDVPEDEESDDGKSAVTDAQYDTFISLATSTLGERVTEVRTSKVLRSNPVRLIAPEDAQDRQMERVRRFMDDAYEVPVRIMEVNRKHPLIANLSELLEKDGDDALVPIAIEQLYESALVQEGLHPNPANMLPRIQELIGLAADIKNK